MPTTALPSPTWTTARTPAGVLSAMTADGLLAEVLPAVWLPTDLAGDPTARAAALVVHLADAAGPVRARGDARGPVPAGAVVALAAAAWLHGCPTPPRRVDLLVPRGTGPGRPGGSTRLRRVPDPERGACTLGGLAVTGPARTVEDLRGSPDPQDRAALAWAAPHWAAPHWAAPHWAAPHWALRLQVGRAGQAPACSARRPVAR